jgi:hypothetical protein
MGQVGRLVGSFSRQTPIEAGVIADGHCETGRAFS